MLVGLAMSAAFLTKQSTLVAVLPLDIYLIAVRRRVGVAATGTLAAAVVGSTLVLDGLSQGWYRYYIFGELIHQGTDPTIWWRFVPGDLVGRVGWMMGLGAVGSSSGGVDAAPPPSGPSGWRRRRASWRHRGSPAPTSVAAKTSSSPPSPPWLCSRALAYDTVRRAPSAHRTLAAAAVLAVLVVQVVSIGGHPTHLVPTPTDAEAGRRFVAMISATPGTVLVLDHPWYDTLAGKASWAQDDAIHDVLRAGPSEARTDLLRSIRAILATPQVGVIYVDSTSVDPVIQEALDRYYRPSGQVFSCYRCFFPVTDVAFRPYLRYVRR